MIRKIQDVHQRNALFFVFIYFILALQLNFQFSRYEEIKSISKEFPIITNENGSKDKVYPLQIPYDDNQYFKNFKIELKFRNYSFPSGNLFQTDNEGSGIRIEQVPYENEVKIQVQYRAWNEERFLISDKTYTPYDSHSFVMNLDYRNNLRILIDEKLFIKTKIEKQDIKFQNFILGSGLSGSRIFVGEITEAKLKLEMAKRHLLIPLPTFLLTYIILLFIIFRIYQRFRITKQIVNITSVLICSSVVIGIYAMKPFSPFFGDDLLGIWPLRKATPFTIFSEGLGNSYRPLTALALMLRWELHGYEIQNWEFGSYFLLFVAVLTTFITIQLMNIDIGISVLLILVIFTSPIYMASNVWWASNGTQHLIQIILTNCFIVSLYREMVSKETRKFRLKTSMFIAFLLALTSELFYPILITLGLVIFMVEKGIVKVSQKYVKSTKSLKADLKFVDFVSLKLNIILISLLWIFRNNIAQVSKPTIAASAINQDIDLGIVSQDAFKSVYKYFFSFFNIYLSDKFFEMGAGEWNMSEFHFDFNLQSFFTLASCLGFTFLTFHILKSVSWIKADLKEYAFVLAILIFALISIVAPSQAVDYFQLRWLQMFYLMIFIVFVKTCHIIEKLNTFRFKLVLVLLLISMLTSNLFALNQNFQIF